MKDQVQSAKSLSGQSRLFRKLAACGDIRADARTALAGLVGNERHIPRGTDFVRIGATPKTALVIESGWAIRYALTMDGRRQIASVVLPGDVVGFEAAISGRAMFNAAALSDLGVFEFRAADLVEIVGRHPMLLRALAWSHNTHISLLENQTLRIGRLGAGQRIAHFVQELVNRLEVMGENCESGIAFPMTQSDLGDALGLSVVHTNRQLQLFRRGGVFSLLNGKLTVHDRAALARIASTGFDVAGFAA